MSDAEAIAKVLNLDARIKESEARQPHSSHEASEQHQDGQDGHLSVTNPFESEFPSSDHAGHNPPSLLVSTRENVINPFARCQSLTRD